MSLIVLADTGPLYAAVDPDDQYHTRSQTDIQRLIAGNHSIAVVMPILLETYNLVVRRLSLPTAHTWLEDATNSLLINPVEEDYLQASRLIRRYDDQPITLFDGVLAILSERLDLPIWSYDHHFDALRVTRWIPA